MNTDYHIQYKLFTVLSQIYENITLDVEEDACIVNSDAFNMKEMTSKLRLL